ncbi:MAG TPA: 6-phosphogluconolactonase [Clostridiales bacterium]|mgnify:CR=1 FL=1|nr:MAG: Glucosamine-6-phosphate deaminase 1 [Firmicutes bacterium ADurb.Bin262]HOU10719.1 6-phosphogluconolactonase [Clostridiales bacterium]HQH62671.1 6-phosphogluconolactonase [Clostridiales bacterium]HQK74411.1 6-phosphogluconolactonase [Clostridiales bacterium]
MNIFICENPVELGLKAAALAAECIGAAIAANGTARIVVSTGASQFETFEALIASDIDFSRVEMFHLDEYVNLPQTHPASFRKYLTERFVSKVNLLSAHFVEPTPEGVEVVTRKLLEKPVDLGLIGIGENGHIAFNDPPADFETRVPYIIVNLSDTCKKQQVREGWFASVEEVPAQAVSMSVDRILRCKKIISCVPHAVKAKAVYDTLNNEPDPMIPATILKTHPDWSLFLDTASASLLKG